MKLFIRATLLAVIIALTASCTSTPDTTKQTANAVKPYQVGDTITQFTLKGIDKKSTISFDDDIKGKSKAIAIIFFTATCSSCKEEISFLSNLANSSGDDLKVYAVKESFSTKLEHLTPSKPLLNNINYIEDKDFTLMVRFGFKYAPSLALADSSGKITFFKSGYSTTDNTEISNEVRKILGK